MSDKTPEGPPRRLSPKQFEAKAKARLEKISPELYSIYCTLRDKRDEAARGLILYYYMIGQQFRRVFQKYKKGGLTALAASLELAPPDVRAAMRLADAYPKSQDLAEVLAKRDGSGKTLQWGHIRQLVTESFDAQERARWIDRCLAEQWSAADLAAKLQAHLGHRGQGASAGRPFVLPPHFTRAVLKLDAMSRVWVKAAEAGYTDPDRLAEILAGTPAEALGPDTRDQVVRLDQQLARVEETAAAERKALAKVLKKFDAAPAPAADAAAADGDAGDAAAAAAAAAAPPKKKPGRPKGSKNKAKAVQKALAAAKAGKEGKRPPKKPSGLAQ